MKPAGGRAKKPRRRRLSPAEKARIAEIFRRFEAAAPHPRTELEYKTPFTLLVAVVLSAQATDKSVNKATERSTRSPTRRSRCWRSARPA